MKKLIFSLAGVALVAGTALAFTTAKSNEPLPCDNQAVPENCTEVTTPDDPEACCFKDIPGVGTQYYRLEDN